MYPAHWAEISVGKEGVPLDMNYERYKQLESAGMLHVAVARVEGALVGYHMFIISPHLHHMSTVAAFTDIVYLKPKYRKGFNGVRFLRFAVDSLRSTAAKRAYVQSTVSKPFGKVLTWLGFAKAETTYFKDLR